MFIVVLFAVRLRAGMGKRLRNGAAPSIRGLHERETRADGPGLKSGSGVAHRCGLAVDPVEHGRLQSRTSLVTLLPDVGSSCYEDGDGDGNGESAKAGIFVGFG
jgi:hypothetical protein